MELRQIRYFVAVAEEQNFTRAAARVGIGQPSLSEQIKDLEAEVGASLFHRVPHGAELTEAGRAFLDKTRTITAQTEAAVSSAQRAARGEIGALRVGFTGSAVFNPLVASAVRAFRRAYPDVILKLAEANTSCLLADLRSGEVDIAFLRQESAGGNDLQLRPLTEERMVAVLPVNHPEAARTEVALSSLRNDAFILIPRDAGTTLYDTVISACRRAGFEAILGQSAPQVGSVVSLVAAELGVSLVPVCMGQLQVNGVIYREIEGEAPVARLTLAFRRGETSQIIRHFIAHACSNRIE
jgi:DNA-binding transcriptional LysR family regulator